MTGKCLWFLERLLVLPLYLKYFILNSKKMAATNAKFPVLQTGIHTPIPKRISQQEVTCPSVGSLQMAS